MVGKTFGHLGQSCFLRENFQCTKVCRLRLTFLNEKNNGETLLKLIRSNLIVSSHDVSNGGLLTAISEMSLNSDYGANISKPKKLTNSSEYFFGEDQARYILEIEKKTYLRPRKF